MGVLCRAAHWLSILKRSCRNMYTWPRKDLSCQHLESAGHISGTRAYTKHRVVMTLFQIWEYFFLGVFAFSYFDLPQRVHWNLVSVLETLTRRWPWKHRVIHVFMSLTKNEIIQVPRRNITENPFGSRRFWTFSRCGRLHFRNTSVFNCCAPPSAVSL